MAVSQEGELKPAAFDRRSAEPRRSTPALVLEGMRPRQWTKNVFVLAALVFSGEALDAESVLYTLIVLVAFCLASGATYLINDAIDAETDRLNPRTAKRPIARGDLAVRTAWVSGGLAALIALALAALVNWETLGVIGGFLLLQLAYSGWLKHVLFLDVMAISAGFVLRALAGLVAIDTSMSEWLLACTGLLALFLGLAKRRAEAVAMGAKKHPQRPVLEHYSLTLLDELIAVVTPAILMIYTIWATIGARAGSVMLVTAPFVLYGIFRLLYLIHHENEAEEAEMILWRDRPLLVCILLWGLTSGLIGVINS